MTIAQSLSGEEIMAKFTEWTASPGEGLTRWKEKNKKKIIGCFPMDIPEEIIHAAGMLPVVHLGKQRAHYSGPCAHFAVQLRNCSERHRRRGERETGFPGRHRHLRNLSSSPAPAFHPPEDRTPGPISANLPPRDRHERRRTDIHGG